MTRYDGQDPLKEWFRSVLTNFGEASGTAIIKSFVAYCGGLRVTVPSLQDLHRQERDQRIRSAFTGSNYSELAERFGISIRQVRYIVDSERAHSG